MKGKLLTGVMYLVYWVDLTGIHHICGRLKYIVDKPGELHRISLFGLQRSASETKQSQ
jgi:hypothetical protein